MVDRRPLPPSLSDLMRVAFGFCILAVLCFFSLGCERDDGIEVYRVSKPEDMPSPPPPPSALGQMPPAAVGAMDVHAAAGEVPDWKVPAEWTQKTPGSMRKATFAAGPNGAVDISVSSFPGDVGGDLANVNRWRQQIGLGPVDEAALSREIQSRTAADGPMKFVEIQGTEAATFAGWTLHGDQSWFFKMTGPREAVAAERERFQTFLQSVQFHP